MAVLFWYVKAHVYTGQGTFKVPEVKVSELHGHVYLVSLYLWRTGLNTLYLLRLSQDWWLPDVRNDPWVRHPKR